MRNGQNQNKRMRNRNNKQSEPERQQPARSKSDDPGVRVNGPDIKIRGTASHVAEKYVQLARDARSSGDPVAAENYYQHAEHYFRLIAAAQEQFRQNQPQPRTENEMAPRGWRRREREFSNFGRSPASCRRAAALRAARQSAAARTAARGPALPAARAAAADISLANIIASIVRSRNPSRSLSRSRSLPTSTSIACRPSSPDRSRKSAARRPASKGSWRTLPAPSPPAHHGPRPEGAAAPAAPSEDFNPGNE